MSTHQTTPDALAAAAAEYLAAAAEFRRQAAVRPRTDLDGLIAAANEVTRTDLTLTRALGLTDPGGLAAYAYRMRAEARAEIAPAALVEYIRAAEAARIA